MGHGQFKLGWLEVRDLELARATHIKGFRLGSYPADNILTYAKGEIDELRRAPDDIDEMADAMCLLSAYCHHKGWSMEEVGLAMRKKLRVRFVEAEKLLGPLTEAPIRSEE